MINLFLFIGRSLRLCAFAREINYGIIALSIEKS